MNEATGNEPTMNTAQRIVARERRARISHTIRELVAERQQVLVYYWYRLNGTDVARYRDYRFTVDG